ncbi:MAG: hypothetical protein HOB79_08570 [Rhodospirillaceae bacterium]|jgi:hypothetical protein|nr:hypothetical protein [Rhodospirillaceae bacterium]
MSVYRDIFFTKADEAELSAVIRDKYPTVQFIEDRFWPTCDSIPESLNSIDQAKTEEVNIVVPGENWRPKLEYRDFGNWEEGYRITNFPQLHGFIRRSSGGWGPNALTEDGEPRNILSGQMYFLYEPPATKEQKSFYQAIWRRFDKVATCDIQPLEYQTRRRLPPHRDKMLWAGHDAIRWANENKLRVLVEGSTLYKPIR